jgi:hypothetical protein
MGSKVAYAVFGYHVNYPNVGLINDEFVPYPQALALKELGYDIPTSGSYTNETKFNFTTGGFMYRTTPSEPEFCIAPQYHQAFKWLIRKYNFNICVDLFPTQGFKNWLDSLNHYIKLAKRVEKTKM